MFWLSGQDRREFLIRSCVAFAINRNIQEGGVPY